VLVDAAQCLGKDSGYRQDPDLGVCLPQGEGISNDELFYGGVGDAFIGGAREDGVGDASADGQGAFLLQELGGFDEGAVCPAHRR